MSLLQVVLVLIVVGVLLWLVDTMIPMEQTIRRIINVVVIVAVVLWLLSAFGLFGHANAIRIPSVH